MIDDPFLRALEQANPVPHARDVELPPLGPLPRRRRRTAARRARRDRAGARDRDRASRWPRPRPRAATRCSRAPSRGDGSRILYWRVRTDAPGLGAWTDDVWMHVRGDGTIDRVHELRLDGDYAGMESVIEQPYGLGDLRDAVTRTRAGADRPIRIGEGIGMRRARLHRGHRDRRAGRARRARRRRRRARSTSRAARRTRSASARPRPRPGTPAQPHRSSRSRCGSSATSGRPLAVRWGEGAERWRTGATCWPSSACRRRAQPGAARLRLDRVG